MPHSTIFLYYGYVFQHNVTLVVGNIGNWDRGKIRVNERKNIFRSKMVNRKNKDE